MATYHVCYRDNGAEHSVYTRARSAALAVDWACRYLGRDLWGAVAYVETDSAGVWVRL